uniref:Glycosyl transferase CAP10 domain-containing protein n=1 Tax=Aegilops tauschii subsp. strangulata TaxID=200361 RepID=A0A452Y092_AEGTS
RRTTTRCPGRGRCWGTTWSRRRGTRSRTTRAARRRAPRSGAHPTSPASRRSRSRSRRRRRRPTRRGRGSARPTSPPSAATWRPGGAATAAAAASRARSSSRAATARPCASPSRAAGRGCTWTSTTPASRAARSSPCGACCSSCGATPAASRTWTSCSTAWTGRPSTAPSTPARARRRRLPCSATAPPATTWTSRSRTGPSGAGRRRTSSRGPGSSGASSRAPGGCGGRTGCPRRTGRATRTWRRPSASRCSPATTPTYGEPRSCAKTGRRRPSPGTRTPSSPASARTGNSPSSSISIQASIHQSMAANVLIMGWRCRYKIYAEGFAWSVSLKYILSCGSMALLIDPLYQDFFSRGLEPRVNHWPVSTVGMCESIRDAVEWGNAHPEDAERVGKRGQRLMQELGMDTVYDYMLHLLTEYAALLDFRPGPPHSSQEVCAGSVLCLADDRQRRFLEASAAYPATAGPCSMPPSDG